MCICVYVVMDVCYMYKRNFFLGFNVCIVCVGIWLLCHGGVWSTGRNHDSDHFAWQENLKYKHRSK